MFLEALTLTLLLQAPPEDPPALPAPQSQTRASRPPNRLIHETSPYLLQHAHNPVDWYPWGPEALQRAEAEDRPIFLSIGYSACHWCHVMERESFENEEVAAFLNAHFIAIKVDREERPDLDELYMAAVQQMTGGGGWPMTVFLTPELKPFFGGTYFPPEPSHGRPGFLQILEAMAEAWEHRRPEVEKVAHELGTSLKLELPAAPEDGLPDRDGLPALDRRWVQAFTAVYDPVWGGFGQAPKFPRAEDLRWLLAAAERSGLERAREMALHTLRKMASGGMYDQLGGGFARYSVDARWMVPHFEKMLYDQGTLLPAYLEAWRQTGDAFFAGIVRESCDYLLREMRSPEGAFWSSTDADSEGEEGRFFVWTPGQLEAALGPERARFAAALYGVTDHGNFEHGASVLSRAATPAEAARAAGTDTADPGGLAAQVRADLYAQRLQRVPPATDDKVLAGWNGLVIDALARAGRMLDEPRYTRAAGEAADFLLRELRGPDGWRRSWRSGRSQHRAVLEDHAYLVRAFLSLFQSTGDRRWLEEAERTGGTLLTRFWNPGTGIFWDTDGADETLLHRRISPWDGAAPSPNAAALESLLLLHAFTGVEAWRTPAEKGYAAVLALAERGPRAFTASLRPLAWALEEPPVAVVVGTGSRDSLAGWRKAIFAPGARAVLPVFLNAADPEIELGLFARRAARGDKATLYLCRGSSCLPPSNDPSEFASLAQR